MSKETEVLLTPNKVLGIVCHVLVISQHSDHDPGKPLCASLVLPELRKLVAARLQELE